MNWNTLGWTALLLAVAGELLVPFLLAPFYRGYSHRATALSVLGCTASPVRRAYNLWMLLAGLLFLAACPALYRASLPQSSLLAVLSAAFLAVFAVGACVLSCFFSVGETRAQMNAAAKIHGVGSAAGFMLLLPVPLFLAVLRHRAGDAPGAAVCGGSFGLALIAFVLFIASDKPEAAKGVRALEGLWQRLNLLFLYLPLVYMALVHL